MVKFDVPPVRVFCFNNGRQHVWKGLVWMRAFANATLFRWHFSGCLFGLEMLAMHSTLGKHIIFSDLKGLGVQDINSLLMECCPVCAGGIAWRLRKIKSVIVASLFCSL
ncbi:uncharacterized protein J3R85_002682 [Psidium guajava]|nr:uncharacterized protein J3R85_002682 [Psidium guajava]